ncbi:MAG: cupin domain-containing protein [Candidatus Eisenbacteria bacterium]|nr:cupin domain-containing protein [Candidatus Eisenbacteria bacterium]MCC7141292.1 cupin domain-containing protein [Candidatus Eisenbacteria bacterium]
MPGKTSFVKAGRGEVLRVLAQEAQVKCAGEETGGQWALFELTIQSDDCTPVHYHEWDEAYYILSGEVEFVLDGQRLRASTGDFLNVPRGIPHTIIGVAPFSRALQLAFPSNLEAFYREMNEEPIELPQDLDRVLEIAKRHEITPIFEPLP